MSTNQIKRLRTMLRHSQTKPSWLRVVRDPAPKTAGELTDDLDWDGWQMPDPEHAHRDFLRLSTLESTNNMHGRKGTGRDPVLQARKEGERALVLSGERVGQVVLVPGEGWAPSEHSYAARAVSNHRPRPRRPNGSAATAKTKQERDFKALEDDNEMLRRQVQLLMEQVANGEHKLPKLNLGNVPRPPLGDAPSGTTFLTEPAATDRGRRYNLRRAVDTDADVLSRGPSGSQTDRPPTDRRRSVWDGPSADGLSPRSQTTEHPHAPITLRKHSFFIHPSLAESDEVARPLAAQTFGPCVCTRAHS
jgi:hypothetical protein